MIYYKLHYDQNMTVQCIRYADSLPIRQAAEYMCNDVLSYDEHNYLYLLRERYNINERDERNKSYPRVYATTFYADRKSNASI